MSSLGIPNVPDGTPENLRPLLQALREVALRVLGESKNSDDALVTQKTLADLGLTGSLTIKDGAGNVLIGADTAQPLSSGLYVGSDYLGYYDATGGIWKTYMDHTGKFYLGGASGSLQWNGSTLTINGNGTFSGSLSAATGTFGAVTIAPSGSLSSGQSAYNTGVGFWLGQVSGTPKFSIGDPAGANMTWDGSVLNVNAPTFDGFSASIGGGNLTVSVSYGLQTYGSRTVTVTGGKAPYTYCWLVVKTGSGNRYGEQYVSSGQASATATFAGDAQSCTMTSTVLCLVKDSNERATFASFALSATHASDPGWPGGAGP